MPAQAAAPVVWHDVECGSYETDLATWATLADEHPGPILEIGCGTGRVALELAGRGHQVAGVDLDSVLVEALRDRAAARGLSVKAEVADVRELTPAPEFGLVIAPMQVLQLLEGGGRRAALQAMRMQLAAGGVLAVAIVEGVPAGSRELGQPLPDVREVDGWVYSSLPLEIVDEGDRMVVTRLRQLVSPDGDLTETVEVTTLFVLDLARLEAEARESGLRTVGRREVPSTSTHVGSTVVLLQAEGPGDV